MIYFYFICSQKRQFQPKLILINNVPIVLLVINHTEMLLLLNNHLYNKRDIIKNVLVRIYSANIEVNQAQVLSKFSDLIKGISFSWRPQCIF